MVVITNLSLDYKNSHTTITTYSNNQNEKHFRFTSYLFDYCTSPNHVSMVLMKVVLVDFRHSLPRYKDYIVLSALIILTYV